MKFIVTYEFGHGLSVKEEVEAENAEYAKLNSLGPKAKTITQVNGKLFYFDTSKVLFVTVTPK